MHEEDGQHAAAGGSPQGDTAGPAVGPALAALCLVALGVAIHTTVLGALRNFLPDELAGDDSGFGVLLAVAASAGAAGAVIVGPAFDRYGRRTMLLGSIGAFSLGSLWHLVADGYTEFAIARGVTGFAGGAAYAGASIAIADLVPYARRGRAMMIFSAVVFLAMPVGLPFAVWCAKAVSWRGIFVLQTVFAVVSLLGVLRFVPDGLGVRRSADARPGGSLRAALRAPGVMPALVSAALYSGAFFATVQFASGWMHDEGLLDKGRQELMWVALGIASVGSIALGGFADRLGKRLFVMITTLAVGVGIAALGFVGHVVWAAVIGLPVALLAASRAGALLALMTALVPAQARGSLMGFRSGFIQIGMASMSWLAGVLSENGGFKVLAVGMAVVIAVAFVLIGVGVREPDGDVDAGAAVPAHDRTRVGDPNAATAEGVDA